MMMNKPGVTELMAKTGCRYQLVCNVAKRARQLNEGAEPLVKLTTTKPVTIAIQELYEDKISFAEPEKDDLFDV